MAKLVDKNQGNPFEMQVEKEEPALEEKELQEENDKIQAVINQMDSSQTQLENNNAKIEKQIKDYNNTLNSMLNSSSSSLVYDGGAFLWPVPGYYGISAGWQSNDSAQTTVAPITIKNTAVAVAAADTETM